MSGNQLTDDQQQITSQLQALLRRRIQIDGPMPFSEYMRACLYEPELGYYVNGLSKIGAGGDFITAPELSASFASCLATQAAEVFNAESFQRAAGCDILEFGAGSGRLACDVLKALDQQQSLPDHYLILEVSGQLTGLQQELLSSELEPRLHERVQWVQSLPTKFSGVVLANEVFDAFAIERFTVEHSEIQRVFVDYVYHDNSESRIAEGGTAETLGGEYSVPEDGCFVVTTQPDKRVQEVVENLQSSLQQTFAPGYTSEYCESLHPWWNSLADVMQQGLILICDYGCEQASYYSPSRNEGTLRCFFRHGVHNDPLVYAGVQDLTADVDFTALTQAAVDAGFELEGYTPMTQFMLGNDVLQHHQAALVNASEREQIAATGRLKQLLLPQEMGERFMVAGYSIGLQKPLRGFSLADWSRLL